MSDRHQELLRQRALVQEHLAWLDREIAAAAPNPGGLKLKIPAAAPASTLRHSADAILAHAAAPAPAPVISHREASADAILEDYRVAPDALKTDVRKGCFLYFFAALAFVALVVVGLYYALRS